MPNADGTLTPEESAVVDALFKCAQSHVDEMAGVAGPNAAAAVSILAGLHAYEADVGTEGLVVLLRELYDGAQTRLAEGRHDGPLH